MMAEEEIHTPVMLQEVMEWIAPRPGCRYLDATLGLGGHTRRLLELTGGQAQVLGLDRDVEALEKARIRLSSYDGQVFFAQTSFQYFAEALHDIGWGLLDGVIADLGVSSMQLNDPRRGFSFVHDGPLDMRMDPAHGESAAQLVNTARRERLKQILWEYGEEPMAGRIAQAIVEEREKKKIESTLELARIVAGAYPAKRRAMARNHPATKTFQALRIEVNHELQEIEMFLRQIADVMRPGARLVVISFHSLEDRVVKQAFRRESSECVCPPQTMLCQCGHHRKFTLPMRKPLVPGMDEIRRNSRSRSAKLRVAERIGETK